jgi:hypothetical protein
MEGLEKLWFYEALGACSAFCWMWLDIIMDEL